MTSRKKPCSLSQRFRASWVSQAPSGQQEIPATWYRNGVCYAATRETVVELGQTVALRAAGVPVAGTVVSIDEPFDLELCNLLWERARRAGEGGAS